MATLRALDPNMTDQELLKTVLDFFHERLNEHSRANEFLERRRLHDPQLIEHFRLGFADRQLGLSLLTKNSMAGRQIRGRLAEVG
jgi:DNA primase